MPIYCFLDLETTGKKSTDQVWSFAAQFDRCDDNRWTAVAFESGLVTHSISPTPWVLANTNYLDHFYVAKTTSVVGIRYDNKNTKDLIIHQRAFIRTIMMRIASFNEPVYLVGAVPSFDLAFMERLRDHYYPGEDLFHYRTIDVETLAMGFASNFLPGTSPYANTRIDSLRFTPKGLKKAYDALVVQGKTDDGNYKKLYEAHRAFNDMNMARDIFYAVLGISVPGPGPG